MLSNRTRTTIIALVASFTIAAVAAPASFADTKEGSSGGKGCTVTVEDGKGKKSTISMEDGAEITIATTTFTCKNGSVSSAPAKVAPPKTSLPVQSGKAVASAQKL